MDQPADGAGGSRPLVDAASRGDGAAVDELVERHLPALHAFIRLNAGPLLERKESFTDLVQSACREVLEDLSHFAYESEATFRKWLFTAAQRKIKDRLRYHRAQRRDALREASLHRSSSAFSGGDRALIDLYRDSLTPSRMAMVKEDLEAVEHAFSELPEDQRRAIVLRRVVGLDYAEIAAEIGTTEANARQLYSRGSARLLRLLRDRA